MIEIFVFGSNLAGRHGAGAALQAVRFHGAVYGLGVGLMGNSYAIPTKDCALETLPRTIIALYATQFIAYANLQWAFNTEIVTFKVSRVGCGLAGFKDMEIAPLFDLCPPNCYFDTKWRPWLKDVHKYWGTHEPTRKG